MKLFHKIGYFKQIGRALKLVRETAPGLTVASFVLVLVQGVFPLATLYLMKVIVDAITAGVEASDKTAAMTRILFLIAIAAALALFNHVISAVSSTVNEAQGNLVRDKMQSRINEKSIDIDLSFYENPKYYDTLHRAQREAPFRPLRIVNGLFTASRAGISLVAIVGLLVAFHWAIALILFFTAIPGALFKMKYSRFFYQWNREWTETERQTHYLGTLMTQPEYAKEIRLFQLGNIFSEKFDELRNRIREQRVRLSVKRGGYDLIGQVFPVIAVFGAFVLVARQAIGGEITIGSMVMFYQAFQRGQAHFGELMSNMSGLYEDTLFLSYLDELMELEKNVPEPEKPVTFPENIRGNIVFDQVDFSYPGNRGKVLKDISFTVQAGEQIALVGENGAGKTTLIKLLCRLYDPDSGSITIDGVNIKDFRTVDLRKEVGVIFQDYAKYQASARENIWFGNAALSPYDPEIETAGKQAGADSAIERLPDGYDSMLGRMFENGVELSIGEWQKIALARAILRNSQILVLDEPTSSLDVVTETHFFNRIREIARGKTVFLISHRLSTVRVADRIAFLKNGELNEYGTHEELMKKQGNYARLFTMQSRFYTNENGKQ